MVFVSVLVALQGPNVSFGGGGGAERLVQRLAKQGVGPVAVFADPSDDFHSFAGVPRSELTGARLAKEARLLHYGTTLGLSAPRLPKGFLLRNYYEDYARAVGTPAKLRSKAGKIEVDGRTSPWVSVGELADLSLSKPLKTHWLWRTAYVAVTPGTFDERQLLQTVADALGAEFGEEKTGYTFGFDAKRHRARAIARYTDDSWTVPEHDFATARAMFGAVADATDDATWTESYKTSTTTLRVTKLDANIEPVRLALRHRRNDVQDALATGQMDAYREMKGNLDRVRTDQGAWFWLSATGRMSVVVPLDDHRTWIAI